jgi:hypothetical protein
MARMISFQACCLKRAQGLPLKVHTIDLQMLRDAWQRMECCEFLNNPVPGKSKTSGRAGNDFVRSPLAMNAPLQVLSSRTWR